MLKKNFITGIMLLILSPAINAQVSPILDSVKHEMYNINKVFDSSGYLGFSVNITYNELSDSPAVYNSYEKHVEYQLNNKCYYYKVDDIEYMQNDSFAVNIDHTEKTVMALKNNASSLSSTFMIKDFIDNTIGSYDSVYAITIYNIDSLTREIHFITNDSLVPYHEFYLTYDIETHQPLKIGVKFNQGGKSLVLTFLDYRHIATGKIFDEHNYFYKDRATKRYSPSEKYKYYQLVTAGLDEEELENNPRVLKESSVPEQ